MKRKGIFGRPVRVRMVSDAPSARIFRPYGLHKGKRGREYLTVDEFEAIRLADYDGLYQASAAEQMDVSRQTFGRILQSAHRKVAKFLVEANALKIEGGEIKMDVRIFQCYECNHKWQQPYGTGRPAECPVCKSTNIHRAEEDRGWARGPRGRRRGRGGGGREDMD